MISNLAKQNEVYIMGALNTFTPGEKLKGNGIIPFVDTEYGRIGSVILCWRFTTLDMYCFYSFLIY
jgi:hypothetical protein